MSDDMRSFGSYTRRIASLEKDVQTAIEINHRLRIERDMARDAVERLRHMAHRRAEIAYYVWLRLHDTYDASDDWDIWAQVSIALRRAADSMGEGDL